MFGVSRRIQPAPFIDACKSLASVRNDNDPEAATREEWRKSCAPLDIRNVWQIRTERKEERIFCHVIRTSEVSMHCFESRCCGIVAIPHLVARRFGMSCCQHAPQSDQQRRRVQFLPCTQKPIILYIVVEHVIQRASTTRKALPRFLDAAHFKTLCQISGIKYY